MSGPVLCSAPFGANGVRAADMKYVFVKHTVKVDFPNFCEETVNAIPSPTLNQNVNYGKFRLRFHGVFSILSFTCLF